MIEDFKNMPDAVLVKKCLDGKNEAFSVLVKRYEPVIFAFVMTRVKDPNTAQDIVQDTFIRGYKSLSSLSKPDSFQKWMFQVASNLCKDWLKNKRRKEVSIENVQTPSIRTTQEINKEELLKKVDEIIHDLPDEIQVVISMKHQQGMSCAQIAQLLGKPMGTVTSILARAYEAIRKKTEESHDL